MAPRTVQRREFRATLQRGLARAPVTALLGPRQSGKTTLARQIARSLRSSHYFDLEDPDDLRALEHAKAALSGLKGLDVLSAVYLVRQLPPWFANVAKRQVKAPKVYFRDSGVLHRLLDITSAKALIAHPKCGASWEGFVIEYLLRRCNDAQGYFWGTYAGAELDLLLVRGERRFGFEVKWGDAPAVTKSMHIALADLRLDTLALVYPGDRRAALDRKIELLPLALLDDYLRERKLLVPAARRRKQQR